MKVSVFDTPTTAKLHSSRHHYNGRRRFSGGVNVQFELSLTRQQGTLDRCSNGYCLSLRLKHSTELRAYPHQQIKLELSRQNSFLVFIGWHVPAESFYLHFRQNIIPDNLAFIINVLLVLTITLNSDKSRKAYSHIF